MGYYTRYEFEVIDGNDFKTNYEEELTNFTDYDYLFDDAIKWYSYEKDMITFSKAHPNVLFCISGEGELSDDIWKHYFKNGKSMYCKAKIIFDDYDESKLI